MTDVETTLKAHAPRSRALASGAIVTALGACSPHAAAQSPRPEARPSISVTPAQTPTPGSPDNFTGQATIEPLFWFNETRKGSAATVTFEPGARTTWHTHPAGQTLVVTQGAGWVTQFGHEPQPMQAGDVVWIPPRVKHWHGASTGGPMTHVAYQEQVDGEVVEWLEPVGDEQYPKRANPTREQGEER